MSEHVIGGPPPQSSSTATRILAVPVVVVLLVAGLWFFGAVVTSSYIASIGFSVGWFTLVGIACLLVAKRWPRLRFPVLGTVAVVGAVGAVGFYLTSIRDEVVNEVVATGVAASEASGGASGRAPDGAPVNLVESRGGFERLAHPGSGTASVVRLAGGGRVLTFTNFETDNGPDLRVYLVAGTVNGNGDGEDSIDLGGLKGNVGDQQYAIPPDTDLQRLRTVVIWCRAFSVGFARAPLMAA